MAEFHRRLPHHYPQGKWLFVTCHLHGSLPHAKYPPPGKMNSGAAFVWIDRYLDSTRSGPTYLAQEPIARVVVASLRRGILLGHYDLAAYAILSNHMHLLLLPKTSASRLLQSLKGSAARQANRILGRTGGDVLASRVLRPLGPRRKRMEADSDLHRAKPGESRAGPACRGLPMVERLRAAGQRRDESRRCRHECLRHVCG